MTIVDDLVPKASPEHVTLNMKLAPATDRTGQAINNRSSLSDLVILQLIAAYHVYKPTVRQRREPPS